MLAFSVFLDFLDSRIFMLCCPRVSLALNIGQIRVKILFYRLAKPNFFFIGRVCELPLGSKGCLFLFKLLRKAKARKAALFAVTPRDAGRDKATERTIL